MIDSTTTSRRLISSVIHRLYLHVIDLLVISRFVSGCRFPKAENEKIDNEDTYISIADMLSCTVKQAEKLNFVKSTSFEEICQNFKKQNLANDDDCKGKMKNCKIIEVVHYEY